MLERLKTLPKITIKRTLMHFKSVFDSDYR